MHVAGLLGQLFFLKKIQNDGRKWFEVLATAATILLAHTRIFTRLILISIVVRFPLGADPTLKKYLSWRMLEKT